ncbi:MAG TPA: GNAT family N-acetyltransferase [Nocardioidaceae bacterium]|nr:GNAT family N-acetyltransferase [Nocardioidaceae bacterium]
MTDVAVHVLGEEDWQTYRRLRLAALKSDPDSFAADPAAEERYDEQRWRERMRRSRRLVASRGEGDIGVASVGPARDDEGVMEGIAELFGMWVAPEARGSGVAWELVTAAAKQAHKDGHHQLRLWVSTDNGRAVGFYSSYGFRPADERRPMTTDDTVEEAAMTLPLS